MKKIDFYKYSLKKISLFNQMIRKPKPNDWKNSLNSKQIERFQTSKYKNLFSKQIDSIPELDDQFIEEMEKNSMSFDTKKQNERKFSKIQSIVKVYNNCQTNNLLETYLTSESKQNCCYITLFVE
jgi:hypothetical protein